jgi:hypothetical protein
VIALSLNPDLDIAQLAAEYARGGKVRIANVLTPDSAEALAACLETETPLQDRHLERRRAAGSNAQPEHSLARSGHSQRG